MNRNTTETIQGNEAMVSDKFERLRHIHFTSAMISEMEVVGYIRQLNLGKAAGADGLTAEHYVYAIGSSVPLHISSMLTVCLQHGLVPETFLHGVLIPIYKTDKDSSKANSYRPVTLSVTLTKILENVHSRNMFGAPSATSCPVWVYIASRNGHGHRSRT